MREKSRPSWRVVVFAGLVSALVFGVGACGSSEEPRVRRVSSSSRPRRSGRTWGCSKMPSCPLRRGSADLTVRRRRRVGTPWRWGQRGRPTYLLVHSPADQGSSWPMATGRCALPFAYNFFVVVGPAADPARSARPRPQPRRLDETSQRTPPRLSRVATSLALTEEKATEAVGRGSIMPEGAWYVSTRARDGRDPACRPREGRLHAHRHRDLPPEVLSRPGRPSARVATT